MDKTSHFVNAFVIDREGRRIDRRNAEDIFVARYNNEIPPGAGDVVHYRLDFCHPSVVLAEAELGNTDAEMVVGDLAGAYSRRINIQHRLVYQVLPQERIVKVLRMWSRYE